MDEVLECSVKDITVYPGHSWRFALRIKTVKGESEFEFSEDEMRGLREEIENFSIVLGPYVVEDEED